MIVIGYQGKKFSNCYEATIELIEGDIIKSLNDSVVVTPYATANKLKDALLQGYCDYAVFPTTNSIMGSVEGTREALSKILYDVVDSVKIDINHCLFGNPGVEKYSDLVLSHPQALAQCSKYLEDHGYRTQNVNSTSLAASLIKDSNSGDLCICSLKAGEEMGLHLLSKDISNEVFNTTKFSMVSLKLPVMDKNNLSGFYEYKSESYINKTAIPYNLTRCLRIYKESDTTVVEGYIEGRSEPFFRTKLKDGNYQYEINKYFSPGRKGRVFLYVEDERLDGYFIVDHNVENKVFGKMHIKKIPELRFKRITSEKL